MFLSACGNAPPREKPKGHLFEFRNLIARHTTLDEAQGMNLFSNCAADGRGSTTCEFSQLQIAGIDADKTSAEFVGGTFDYLDAQTASFEYEPLREALVKVYGKPCKSEVAIDAESKDLGKIIRGREIQWCFDNGWLSLMESARHGPDGTSELEFLSNRDVSGEQEYNASTL